MYPLQGKPLPQVRQPNPGLVYPLQGKRLPQVRQPNPGLVYPLQGKRLPQVRQPNPGLVYPLQGKRLPQVRQPNPGLVYTLQGEPLPQVRQPNPGLVYPLQGKRLPQVRQPNPGLVYPSAGQTAATGETTRGIIISHLVVYWRLSLIKDIRGVEGRKYRDFVSNYTIQVEFGSFHNYFWRISSPLECVYISFLKDHNSIGVMFSCHPPAFHPQEADQLSISRDTGFWRDFGYGMMMIVILKHRYCLYKGEKLLPYNGKVAVSYLRIACLVYNRAPYVTKSLERTKSF